MPPGLRISAKFKNIKKGMFSPEVSGRLSKSHLHKAMEKTLDQAVKIAKSNTPVGATNALQDSVKARVDTQVSAHTLDGRLSWEASYASVVEEGGPARWIPIGPLKAWAQAVLGNEKLAYPIQKAIAARGTSANPYVEKTRQQIEEKLVRNFSRMAAELARDLERDY